MYSLQSITLNSNEPSYTTKGHGVCLMDQETNLLVCSLKETHFSSKDEPSESCRVKRLAKLLHSKRTEKQAGTAALISGKIDFKVKLTRRDCKRTFHSKQGSKYQT